MILFLDVFNYNSAKMAHRNEIFANALVLNVH